MRVRVRVRERFCMWLGVVAPLAALLGNVAKVDIRGTGTPSEAILRQLASIYATASIPAVDQLLPTSDIALNAAVSGSYVLEVNSSRATADALTNFWCLHPDQKALFTTTIELLANLTVTEIVTCTGASGTGCTESTCGSTNGGGGVDDGGTPGPAPESKHALAPNVGNEDDDDEDAGGEGDNLSTVGIVLIVLGSLIVVAVLLYLLWPWIETCWKASPNAQKLAAGVTATGAVPLTGACIDLPPLYNPA